MYALLTWQVTIVVMGTLLALFALSSPRMPWEAAYLAFSFSTFLAFLVAGVVAVRRHFRAHRALAPFVAFTSAIAAVFVIRDFPHGSNPYTPILIAAVSIYFVAALYSDRMRLSLFRVTLCVYLEAVTLFCLFVLARAESLFIPLAVMGGLVGMVAAAYAKVDVRPLVRKMGGAIRSGLAAAHERVSRSRQARSVVPRLAPNVSKHIRMTMLALFAWEGTSVTGVLILFSVMHFLFGVEWGAAYSMTATATILAALVTGLAAAFGLFRTALAAFVALALAAFSFVLFSNLEGGIGSFDNMIIIMIAAVIPLGAAYHFAESNFTEKGTIPWSLVPARPVIELASTLIGELIAIYFTFLMFVLLNVAYQNPTLSQTVFMMFVCATCALSLWLLWKPLLESRCQRG